MYTPGKPGYRQGAEWDRLSIKDLAGLKVHNLTLGSSFRQMANYESGGCEDTEGQMRVPGPPWPLWGVEGLREKGEAEGFGHRGGTHCLSLPFRHGQRWTRQWEGQATRPRLPRH